MRRDEWAAAAADLALHVLGRACRGGSVRDGIAIKVCVCVRERGGEGGSLFHP